jgi:hypothetical protein
MTWIRNTFTFFANLKSAWKFAQIAYELNRIRAKYPGLDDEIRLRAWLLESVAYLGVFADATPNKIDDAIVYYVDCIIADEKAWKIIYASMCLANGLVTREITKDDIEPIYGDPDKLMEIDEIIDNKGEILQGVGVKLTHDQLTAIATGAILATVAQMQAA